MPELPEVETTCRGISPHLVNQTITQVIFRHKQLRWPIPIKALKDHLIDATITEVSRRAKYILIQVPTGTVVIHLGMSGTLRIVSATTPLRAHDHFDCILSSNKILRLNDPRRFGALLWLPNHHTLAQLENLGPEPLSTEFTATYLYQSAQKHRSPIKTFIMNQKVVVGVGNIYASESLFMAKIHPEYPANALSLTQYQDLHKAIQKVLGKAIKKGGTTLKDFCQSDGKPGYFSQELKVYDRQEEPCLSCQSPIHAIRLGQRSTYFCPRCQPLPSKFKRKKELLL
ncbi:MAG: DNA-formamidopyrimidine glycosylase [Gammaproteobacteria bacterium 39-13]|nr:bifunctional DNA-formamidopyrimidine glycosylase/DNA-(apurinic or apyrimidinic site) lyase [Gammaproteobacteria bacterium]OJV85629.1 MAG: DNA-formamidopyrimidine glycosylase [Gammaproteobacteria bacterium 39-13]